MRRSPRRHRRSSADRRATVRAGTRPGTHTATTAGFAWNTADEGESLDAEAMLSTPVNRREKEWGARESPSVASQSFYGEGKAPALPTAGDKAELCRPQEPENSTESVH
jgi:hypothetical protein